jgi:tRNA-splicing ligase RtcB
VLLAALEIPVGRKATQDWELPRWVRRAPLWQQRLFLAAFFGAELSAPRGFDRANRSFYCPELTVVKREGFVAGGARFLGQIARLLERFGVTSLTVSKRPEQMNPDGRRSIRLRLVLSNRDENLIRLWSRVGFEYQAKRADLAAAATAYLQRKRAYLRTREHLMRRILEIRAVSGWGAKKIRAALGDAGVHLRFVERTLYGRPERRPRAWDFPTFEEWRRSWVRGGHIWEEIAAKTARDDVRRVYDITVDHPDHRFIAGGFVVHN